MSQFAVGTVHLGPHVEHRDDLVLLVWGEPMNRIPPGSMVVEADPGVDPTMPPLQTTLGQFQIPACRCHAPPVGHRPVDQADQPCLGGRVDPPRDPATQPQGSFPSASVKRTAISANAVLNRSVSARTSANSTSR